jgi:hypothetical protein
MNLEESLRRLRLDLAQARDLRGSLDALVAAERALALFPLTSVVAEIIGTPETDFTVQIPSELELPKVWQPMVREFLFEGLRNWSAHGRESRAERKFQQKPDRARLLVECRILPGRVVLSLEDDGPGLQVTAVLSRAEELGLLRAGERRRIESTLESGDSSAIYELLFRDGLSTRKQADEMAGRGMGLSRLSFEANRFGASLRAEKSVSLGGLALRLELPCRIIGVRAGPHSMSVSGNEILSVERAAGEAASGSRYRIFSLLPAEAAPWAREAFGNPKVAWVALDAVPDSAAGEGRALAPAGLLAARPAEGESP